MRQLKTPPMPGEWHEFYMEHYGGKTGPLMDWLNRKGEHCAACAPSLTLPVPFSLEELRFDAAEDCDEWYLPQLKTVQLVRERAATRAVPWTGRPAMYVWDYATDQYGRRIAGEARREEYEPEPLPFTEQHRLASVQDNVWGSSWCRVWCTCGESFVSGRFATAEERRQRHGVWAAHSLW